MQLSLTSGPPAGAGAWPLQLQPPQGSHPCPPVAAWRPPADKPHDLQHLQGCLPYSQAQMLTDRGGCCTSLVLGTWMCSHPTPPQQRCAGPQELKGEPAAADTPSLARLLTRRGTPASAHKRSHPAGQSRGASNSADQPLPLHQCEQAGAYCQKAHTRQAQRMLACACRSSRSSLLSRLAASRSLRSLT